MTIILKMLAIIAAAWAANLAVMPRAMAAKPRIIRDIAYTILPSVWISIAQLITSPTHR